MDSDLLPHATEFAFLPEGASFGDKEVYYFTVTVARRSDDLWAVCWLYNWPANQASDGR